MDLVVRSPFVRLVTFLLAAFVLSEAVVRAQSTAQISGTVVDSSGGVLPGVTVTAIQTGTGFRREVVTDENGLYTMPNLPLGPYRLEASLSGFRNYAQTGIALQVNDNPVIRVTLQLGALTETVAVEASAPLVETRNPSIGAVIDNERIEELPLNGRNAADLVVLVGAAVRPDGANGVSSSRSMQGGLGISVAGGQTWGVAYLLDGATHNNPYDNYNLPLPFPDALQEFRVETSAQNANNGFHSSASVSVATKAGTNTWHGDLFEFARNHRFNATNPFNAVDPATGKRKDDGLSRNQFGGTFSGPVKTDKLFFFGAYQGTKTNERPSDDVRFVPTPAMLAGDFTQVASAACNTRGALTLAAPFVGNRIDPALFSPAAVKIASKLPSTTDPCGRTGVTNPRNTDEKQVIGRGDMQLSQNHSIFGRYMATTYFYAPPFTESQNVLSTTLGGRDNLAQSLTIGDTMVLSNAMVNNIRFGYNRSAVHRTSVDFFGPSDVGVNSYSYLPHYMLAVVTGGFSLGGGTESDAIFNTNTYSINDDLTMIRGTHQYGLGASVATWDSLSRANVRSPGTYTFDGVVTGLGLADFMLGRPFTFIQSAPNTLDMAQKYFGLYAQDTWKLSSTMTLNYGVRWEPWFPQQQQNGAVYNFSVEGFKASTRSKVFPQAPPGFTYPGDAGFPDGKAGMNTDWLNIAPRVGFAWDPKGDGRMSVRAGYAMNGEFVNGQFFINAANAPPWGSELRLTRPLIGPFDSAFAGTGVANPFPVTFDANAPFSPNGPYLATPQDLTTTRVHNWNLSVQRQLGSAMAVSASYIGNYSQHLWDVVTGNPGIIPGGGSPTDPCTINTVTGPQVVANCSTASLDSRRELTQFNPSLGRLIGFLDYFTDFGTQKYNGLLLQMTRRVGTSSAGVNYTLSKCEGHPTQGGGTSNVGSGYMIPVSIFNPPADRDSRLGTDYGRCDNDRRHIFNASATVATPDFTGARARILASGWRFSGAFRALSGRTLNVTTGADRALTGNPGQQRPNQILDNPYGDKSWNNYLNPAAFAQPAFGTFGNATRNGYYGKGSRVVDLSVVRSFRFGAAHRIEARVETFNLFNWVRPGGLGNNGPVLNITNPNFGRYLQADDPRIMQFALKYQF